MPPILRLSWGGRLPRLAALSAAGFLLATAAIAKDAGQSAKDQPVAATRPASPPPTHSANDPVVASVEGRLIYLSDVGRAEKTLPPNLRSLPFATLFPLLLDRLVDHQALVVRALQRNLEDTPEVKQQIQDATDRILEAALLAQEAAPKVTEAAIEDRYRQRYANRPATEQVRASHILVSTEGAAEQLIGELKRGADFASLAEKYSLDPDGKQGGELGFFSRDQVWPGFADAAFSLQPGQIADKPVHNEFGWHVIKVEERRLVPPPSLAEVHDKIKVELTQEAIAQVVAQARGELTIHEWNLNGSAITPGSHADDAHADDAAAKANR